MITRHDQLAVEIIVCTNSLGPLLCRVSAAKAVQRVSSQRPVFSHGGPTGATSISLDLSIQFWTTRGFAVFNVNYGGSTGYGSEYRKRLNHKWGIVDVQDSVNGSKYLIDKNKADPERLAIRGGSAGG